MSGVLGICLARRRGVHVHLWIARHTHIRAIGGLVRHHMATHWGSRGRDELASLTITHSDVLHVRTHSVLRHLHLLWVAGHGLRLGAIHVRMHGSRGWMDR